MTWGNPPPFKVTCPNVTGKKITPEQLASSGTEHGNQAALFAWASDNVGKYPVLQFMFAIPNGFFGDSGQKAKMKAEGLRNGVLDVFLPVPIQNPLNWSWYHGLYIEMKVEKHRKAKDGGCKPEQIDFMEYAVSAGYYCKVCYNWQEARDTIIDYLEGKL